MDIVFDLDLDRELKWNGQGFGQAVGQGLGQESWLVVVFKIINIFQNEPNMCLSAVHNTDNAKKVCRFFSSYAGISEPVNNVYDAG